jgi:hypothetical protein
MTRISDGWRFHPYVPQKVTFMSDSHHFETKLPWDVFDANCPSSQLPDRIVNRVSFVTWNESL